MQWEPLFDADADAATRANRRLGVPDFDEQEMVGWFEPSVLFAAASEVGLSGLFGNFADKREIQAGLPELTWDGASAAEPDQDFWLDFVADTGDGYTPTFAVAEALSRDIAPDAIDPGDGGAADTTLRQGEVLILGGDQVYPSATWSRYHERFVWPFARAFERNAEAQRDGPPRAPPKLFALPGNHDWYDGLTNFMRLFSQKAWIGGWKTMQTRSYFAIRLPRGWWLWAIDTQFDKYIDGPQLDYFRHVSDELQPGDRLILATAQPSWVDVKKSHTDPPPDSWRTLAFFEQRVINEAAANATPAGQLDPARLVLTLTGDLHHYSRYSERGNRPDRQHKITAGGGGAFLSATHWLEDDLLLPSHHDLPPAGGRLGGDRYDLERLYPTKETSKSFRKGVLRLPLHTPSFGALLGSIYALIAVAIALALKDGASGILQSLRPDDDGRRLIPLLGDALSFWVVAVAFLLLVLLWAYAKYGKVEGRKRLLAIPHWGLHLIAVYVATLSGLALISSFSPAVPEPGSIDIARQGFLAGWLVAIVAFAIGFSVGRAIFAAYLWTASLGDDQSHATEVFASQSRGAAQGYKQFLRMRITSTGKLVVYAIGIEGPVSASSDLKLIDRVDLPGSGPNPGNASG